MGEQLNIEGKRSGDGFVAHKTVLVDAMSRVLAERLDILNCTIGRKGFLKYLKALGGSNVIKVIPSNGDASGARVADKGLKVVCGNHTGYIADQNWISDKTPLTFAGVRVTSHNSVKPNIGATELAEALGRVLPFVAVEDSRPVLQCVNFETKDGKLELVTADGFRLAIATLDYPDEAEGQALIGADDLKGVVTALRRARRARIGFEHGEMGTSLVIDTELVRYKWLGRTGSFPNYRQVIPGKDKLTCRAQFDAVEATRAVTTLMALPGELSVVDITIGDGQVTMTNADMAGQTEIKADTSTDSDVSRRLNGGYLLQVLKACGGMVELGIDPRSLGHQSPSDR